MEDDTGRTLSDIYKSSTQMLVKQIVEIQRHTTSRNGSKVWAERLRFVDISGVITEDVNHSRKRRRTTRNDRDYPFDNHSVRVLRLTDRLPVSRNPYVAISWRWNSDLPLGQGAAGHRYQIQRPKEQPHHSKVPDIYFDRAIRFAQARGIHLLWIDKECIYQENEEDQATGIQGMDLVYRDCKVSLGLLEVELQSQQQLKSLSELLGLKLIDETGPRFREGVPKGQISRILDILGLIISDERWERTWIFQEDHCASSNMLLLVRHVSSLYKDKVFGDLPGELQIRCAQFRKATTMFCIACDVVKQAYPHDLLSKVKQYNIWNQGHGRGRDPKPGNRQLNRVSTDSAELPHLPASSLSILRDIKARRNHVVADRLAIFANCRQYLTRLDVTNLTRADYGLSACFLCLYLLNGEIMTNFVKDRSSEPSQDPKDVLNGSIYEFLERFSLTFDPPCYKFRQSFIDNHCRFGTVKLTSHGTETRGRLWEINETIAFTNSDRHKIKIHDTESEYSSFGFNDCALPVLLRRLKSLKHYSLESEFSNYLTNRQPKLFIHEMIRAVLKGLRHGKALRLARLVGELHALGIFVGDRNDVQNSERIMAFTSFSKKKDKIVSIEVQHDGNSTYGLKRLYTRSWINGVYFAYGRPQEKYLFPWPFAHSYEELAC
ncbi:hypothetical protein OEA41_007976 [Lepraria neglecta]|uniref:Heterokaryon incompatibility domain-containing protein n=1 Tax=Lepraria neglecta TaxID=209136 RepID=A0AAE0DNF8_9LECA|nr:hypothetical protein OEA41_007976 [Lepraria neglecta]